MGIQQKAEHLRSMMAPYEGPQHTVVAFSLQDGETRITRSGAGVSEISDDDLIFEIGSITKVFTAILLRLLAEEGKVDPQAPVSDISDALSDVPHWITPEKLASHTSGLPRIHIPIWKAVLNPLPEDPYAHFTRDDLLAWFRHWSTKTSPAKRRHSYSNLGIGLLGEALALSEGKPFFELLTEKVIAPLGLVDTTDRLDERQRRRFVQPRNTKGKAVTPWTFSAMAAAGCLRSSARDLSRFSTCVIQALNAPETTLDRAICQTAAPIFGLGRRGAIEPAAQCSGWFSTSLAKTEPRILHHDGATAGSTCALYICPEKARALAILSNNGVVANLWASAKLDWSTPVRQAHNHFAKF